MTYVTPSMQYVFSSPGTVGPLRPRDWDELAPVIASIWATPLDQGKRTWFGVSSSPSPPCHLTPTEWRATFAVSPRPVDAWEVALAEGMGLPALTAADGEQRAVDYDAEDLEDLLALRLELRNALASSAPESDLLRVMAWIWRPESTGTAMTPAGSRNGFEVRLSRFAETLY